MNEAVTLTNHMIVVLVILGFSVFLFVSEVVRIDVAAVAIMVTLGVVATIPGYEGIIETGDLFAGFSSNAVISIMAVMVIGAGLDKTGVMSKVATFILKVGGSSERRIIPLISGTVGMISSFMQNIGAAALFLPVVSRISVRSGIPLSRLLMPMGFCAILGGTVTLVGSSPLILLNDLIVGFNSSASQDQQVHTFALFDVSPVGIALVITGIAYFLTAGRMVLPGKSGGGAKGVSTAEYFKRVYGIEIGLFELLVTTRSPLDGHDLFEVQKSGEVKIVAMQIGGHTKVAPLARDQLKAGARIAVIATRQVVDSFAERNKLVVRPFLETFSELLASTNGGICEVVVPPDSKVIGKTFVDLRFREAYGLSPLVVYRTEESLTRVHEVTLHSGDTIVAHTTWDALSRLEKDRDFVVVTSEYPKEELRPRKTGFALLFFVIALSLVLFSDIRLSLCLFVGALGMILTNVVTIDEAYEAIGWKTVFLLASLIPLGLAVQKTGTAEWVAIRTLELTGDVSVWVLQTIVAILATVFTLVMSNVGATVLLVPLAISIALAAGADPAVFALTVAISTSNSFLIPTHQVNALIMGPGGYRVVDFMKAGGIMTVLFLIVSIAVMNMVF